VLILGETGTGKELVARAIHNLSRRKDRTFVKLNCAAIPTGLLESELFGHEKGAFTGAVAQRIGRFELANNGTAFLDEIGEIPLELQPKLLRVLQEREFERLGGVKTLKVDVRVVAATNQDLRAALEQGTFREDLFYRLNVVPISIPPLREHKEDIPYLADYFIERFARDAGKSITGITAAAQKMLMEFHWPGNVRELENIIERAVALTTASVLDVADIRLDNAPPTATASAGGADAPFPPEGQTLEQFEDEIIKEALHRANGNKSQAARLLGLSRNALRYRLTKIGVPDDQQDGS
jgi:transcriptional regulator with GAF, ATPase, and Fis domain